MFFSYWKKLSKFDVCIGLLRHLEVIFGQTLEFTLQRKTLLLIVQMTFISIPNCLAKRLWDFFSARCSQTANSKTLLINCFFLLKRKRREKNVWTCNIKLVYHRWVKWYCWINSLPLNTILFWSLNNYKIQAFIT